MNESNTEPAAATGYQFSKWKIGLLSFASVLVVSGLVVRLFAEPTPEPTTHMVGTAKSGSTEIPADDSSPVTTFAPTGTGQGVYVPGSRQISPAPESTDPWSPALLRGGFGFFLGFCVGYAVRMFIRLAAIFIGLNFLAIAIFAYWGWIDVRWDLMESQFSTWTTGLSEEFESFRAFIAGSLPSTVLSGAGLFTGLKRK